MEMLLRPEFREVFAETVVEYILRGGGSLESAYKVIYIIYNYFKDDYTEEWLQELVNNKHLEILENRNEPGRNLGQEVYDLILTRGSGLVTLADCYADLNPKSKQEKTAIRVALNRLIGRGILEKADTGRTGMYRIVEGNAELIDIDNADITPLHVIFPLRVHEFVNIHKGNVVIVAGESNSGKTAMCLNIADMNKDRFPVNYLSSEMQNGTELRIRLDEFQRPTESWKKIRFRFRTDRFPDVIEPNALNIVDYLDEGKEGEAYKMTRRIKDISEKVKDGLAVIAIQKSSQKRYGFGGEGTKNAARLYLSITPGKLTIEKGKVWRNKFINPDGMYCNFKLVAGCKFTMVGDKWLKD